MKFVKLSLLDRDTTFTFEERNYVVSGTYIPATNIVKCHTVLGGKVQMHVDLVEWLSRDAIVSASY
jgi:hypothetical protein